MNTQAMLDMMKMKMKTEDEDEEEFDRKKESCLRKIS